MDDWGAAMRLELSRSHPVTQLGLRITMYRTCTYKNCLILVKRKFDFILKAQSLMRKERNDDRVHALSSWQLTKSNFPAAHLTRRWVWRNPVEDLPLIIIEDRIRIKNYAVRLNGRRGWECVACVS